MNILNKWTERSVFPEIHYEDKINYMEECVWEWKRIFYLESEEDFQRGLSLRLKCKFIPQWYMMPGINYNGNNWGEGKEPKDLGWCFAYHRTGVPAAMYAQSEEISVALFAKSFAQWSCSAQMYRIDDAFYMELLIPEKEMPDVYCARDCYEGKKYQDLNKKWKSTLEFTAVIVLHERTKPIKNRYEYGIFLRKAWKTFQKDRVYNPHKDDLWKISLSYMKNELFLRREKFSGFCMGLEWNGIEWVQNTDRLEIGWVGQNASLAVSLLYDFYFYQCQDSLEKGLEILDAWSNYASLENGLFRCRFDQKKESKNDAANLYSVVVEYLDAYRILKKMKMDREQYRKIALRVCDFVCEKQSNSGKIGKAWYNNGKISDSEGGIGCYLAEALIYGWRETGNVNYLEGAKKGFQYYYEEFEQYGYTTAGALDTCCIDKESAMPLLRCAVMLYDICKEEVYLKRACNVSDYLATWQYHYNVPYQEHMVLGQIHYRTKGGMAVSVQHHHMDCYGLEIYSTWKRLSALTDDPIWQERAEAIWKNSLQNISDGELVIKGQKRPIGSQDEGFLQTRWHTRRGEYFGVSEWLVAWNTAFRMKILREKKMNDMEKGGRER